MAGLTKEQAAKKPGKKASLHTEPVHDLAPMVDWEEQERIKASLKGKYIPQFRADGALVRSGYNPERAAELCIMRRGGMNLRQIAEKCGTNYTTIKRWLSDYPEFSQEWADAYTDYITDLAEEIPTIAENLLKDLKRDGKKLSAKQFGRYIRSCEFLAQQAQFAAKHRAPQLYGDTDGGMELVLIQPTIPERSVTQDVPRAERWKEESKEAEDAEAGGEDSPGPDGGGGGVPGGTGGEGPGRDAVPEADAVSRPERRNAKRNRPVPEHGQPLEDAGEGPHIS
jgi:hypothetical protein